MTETRVSGPDLEVVTDKAAVMEMAVQGSGPKNAPSARRTLRTVGKGGMMKTPDIQREIKTLLAGQAILAFALSADSSAPSHPAFSGTVGEPTWLSLA